ncbi:DNA starvation/stationary phase protection protein Dps [Sandarakinorhabdus oryzae]|uniref:DNA starvation/stationary phase protection protein Dps n=1 Tax=Sandarakinorhabdus oryzae TaxID=2675220 RepID=UPI0012E0FF20|nr:DNA starvation/stationary phase protection protein Dps [Sandarakinorhabdus oryzae]
MYTSRLDLPEHVRHAAIALLQAMLANAVDLVRQAKQAHWNVKGPNFFMLHQLFDALHDTVEEFEDTIAERITALGGTADARVQTVAATTVLYDYPIAASSGEAHLKALAGSLGEFGKHARAAIEAAAVAGDADTADLFTGLSRECDKQLWFVEAHLVGSN